MIKLRWFLIGIALTAFAADYIHMKASAMQAEASVTKSTALAVRAQASNTACLIELSYNRSLIESWESKRKLTILAQVEVLQMIERARGGDLEAITYLKELGFVIAKPGNHLVASVSYDHGHGMGGF